MEWRSDLSDQGYHVAYIALRHFAALARSVEAWVLVAQLAGAPAFAPSPPGEAQPRIDPASERRAPPPCHQTSSRTCPCQSAGTCESVGRASKRGGERSHEAPPPSAPAPLRRPCCGGDDGASSIL